MNKTLLAIVGIIIVVLIILFVALPGGAPKKEEAKLPPEQDFSKPFEKERVVEQKAEETLSAFPEGFPVEAEAQASDSFKYVPAQSLEQQSTIEYVSKKSLNENAKIFRDYLAANGFTVANEVSEQGLRFFYGTRDNNDLSIKITELSGQVSVSASYLER